MLLPTPEKFYLQLGTCSGRLIIFLPVAFDANSMSLAHDWTQELTIMVWKENPLILILNWENLFSSVFSFEQLDKQALLAFLLNERY